MTAIKDQSPVPLFEKDADPQEFSEFVKQIADDALQRILEKHLASSTVVFDEATCN